VNRTRFTPSGALWCRERQAAPDDANEIRVTADGVMGWRVKNGRLYHFYLSGRGTLRKLADAIIEAQDGG